MYSDGFIASGRHRSAPRRWQVAQLDLLGVVQRDPAGPGFQLAPLGGSGPVALGDDGVGALVADSPVGAVVGAGALADVQHVGRHLTRYEVAVELLLVLMSAASVHPYTVEPPRRRRSGGRGAPCPWRWP